jgi:hypothetical protein
VMQVPLTIDLADVLRLALGHIEANRKTLLRYSSGMSQNPRAAIAKCTADISLVKAAIEHLERAS